MKCCSTNYTSNAEIYHNSYSRSHVHGGFLDQECKYAPWNLKYLSLEAAVLAVWPLKGCSVHMQITITCVHCNGHKPSKSVAQNRQILGLLKTYQSVKHFYDSKHYLWLLNKKKHFYACGVTFHDALKYPHNHTFFPLLAASLCAHSWKQILTTQIRVFRLQML